MLTSFPRLSAILFCATLITACGGGGGGGGGGDAVAGGSPVAGAGVGAGKNTTPLFAQDVDANIKSPLATDPISITGTCGGGISPYKYSWDFGDNTPKAENISVNTIAHSFQSAGEYKVKLTCSDASGSRVPLEKDLIIAVRAAKPPTDVGIQVNPANRSFTFTALAKSPNDDPLTYSWDFGDGSAIETGEGKKTVTHVYVDDSPHTVKLTVSDKHQGSTSTTQAVGVGLPTFSLSPTSAVVRVYKAVPLSANANPAKAGQTLIYKWDFGDGSTFSGQNPPSHAYSQPGTYTVKVTATVSGTENDTNPIQSTVPTIITVKSNSLPKNPVLSPYQIYVATPTPMSAVSSDDDGDPLNYSWDFGDGQTGTGPTPTHTYNSPGIYQVTIRVSDPLNTTTKRANVLVADFSKVASATSCSGSSLVQPEDDPQTIPKGGWCKHDIAPDKQVRGVTAPDVNNIWINGEKSTILYSTDGGVSFTSWSFTDPRSNWVESVHAFSPVAGSADVFAVGTNGLLLAGKTGTKLPTGTDNTVLTADDYGNVPVAQQAHWLSSVAGVKANGTNVLWSVGNQGFVMKRSGGTWNMQSTDKDLSSYELQSLSVISDQVAWAAGAIQDGSMKSVVIKTTNGGSSPWASTFVNNCQLRAIASINASVAWVTGDYGCMYRTTDGGNTWPPLTLPINKRFFGLSVLPAANASQATLMAAGDAGTIIKSTDGGATWKELKTGATSTLVDVKIIDSMNAWAVGDGGAVYHTVTGGE